MLANYVYNINLLAYACQLYRLTENLAAILCNMMIFRVLQHISQYLLLYYRINFAYFAQIMLVNFC